MKRRLRLQQTADGVKKTGTENLLKVYRGGEFYEPTCIATMDRLLRRTTFIVR
jgi:hypothetical protein